MANPVTERIPQFESAEAIRLIQETAVKASGASGKATIIDLRDTDSGAKKFLIVKPDGSTEQVAFEPYPRTHQLGSIDQFADFVPNAEERKITANPTIWVCSGGVKLIFDDSAGSRRECHAYVGLTATAAYAFLLASDRRFNQKDFVKLLRYTLWECLDDAGRLGLKAIRSFSSKNFVTSHGNVEHGRQSLGKELESEIRSDAGDIPEELTLHVRLFTDRALTRRFPIKCAIDIEPAEGTFSLRPLPEQLDAAVDEQLQAIANRLAEDTELPVFYGEA